MYVPTSNAFKKFQVLMNGKVVSNYSFSAGVAILGNKTKFNSQGSHMYFKDIEAYFTFKLHLLRQCFTPINLSKNSWEFPGNSLYSAAL